MKRRLSFFRIGKIERRKRFFMVQMPGSAILPGHAGKKPRFDMDDQFGDRTANKFQRFPAFAAGCIITERIPQPNSQRFPEIVLNVCLLPFALIVRPVGRVGLFGFRIKFPPGCAFSHPLEILFPIPGIILSLPGVEFFLVLSPVLLRRLHMRLAMTLMVESSVRIGPLSVKRTYRQAINRLGLTLSAQTQCPSPGFQFDDVCSRDTRITSAALIGALTLHLRVFLASDAVGNGHIPALNAYAGGPLSVDHALHGLAKTNPADFTSNVYNSVFWRP